MKSLNDDELAKFMQKEYFRNWRANNKDKIKEYNSKYWKKRAEKLKLSNNIETASK